MHVTERFCLSTDKCSEWLNVFLTRRWHSVKGKRVSGVAGYVRQLSVLLPPTAELQGDRPLTKRNEADIRYNALYDGMIGANPLEPR